MVSGIKKASKGKGLVSKLSLEQKYQKEKRKTPYLNQSNIQFLQVLRSVQVHN